MFTSSCKLFTSYTKLANEAWRQMCTFLYLNGVDIFEMNDKRGNGIEFRVAKNWPSHLNEHEEDEITEVLNLVKTSNT